MASVNSPWPLLRNKWPFPGQIRDKDALIAGTAEVPGRHPHACSCHAVLGVCRARQERGFPNVPLPLFSHSKFAAPSFAA